MWIGIIPLEKELVSPTKKVKVINTVGLDGSRWSLRQLRRLTRLSHLSDTSPAACDDNPLSVWKLATSELHKRLLVNDLRDLPPRLWQFESARFKLSHPLDASENHGESRMAVCCCYKFFTVSDLCS